MGRPSTRSLLRCLVVAACAGGAAGQVVSGADAGAGAQVAAGVAGDSGPGPGATVLVVPQQRVFALHGAPEAGVRLEAVQAVVRIVEQVATTSLRVQLLNTTESLQRAEILLPVPAGAVVRGFDFEGQADLPTARLLPRDDARQLYESLVRQVVDPALLEFAGHELVRSSVFPVPPHGAQSVTLVWEQVLPVQGARVDYELPRSQLAAVLAVPWQVSVKLESRHGITTTWSPSHTLRTHRLGPGEALLELDAAAGVAPGPFRLSWLRGERGLATSVLAAPNPVRDGGWLVLLSGVANEAPPDALPREVSLVLDRSGSMRGEKFEQALEAARQVLEGLKPGEAFNLIDYSDQVSSFEPRPVLKDATSLARAREYLELLSVDGGTNIHAALEFVVRQPVTEGFLPVVLFLTDGVPTAGTVDERRIREDTVAANAHGRRLFTFGVGDDVNAPLLDALAGDSRGLSCFVRPQEDVEVKVGEVYRRLFGPVLVEPVLEFLDVQGQPTALRVREQEPKVLSDLYAGDQLLVAARYVGSEPFTFRLRGRTAHGEEVVDCAFDPATASARHDFVPRLWASRRIGTLVDEVRQHGGATHAAGGAGGPALGEPALGEAALGELVQEIVALSTQFGILTEYTAFMATEGSGLFDPGVLRQRTRKLLASRAQQVRTGSGAVSQAENIRRLQSGSKVDRFNAYLDSNLKAIEVSAITYVGDLAFFHASGRWVDARLVALMHAARDAKQAAQAAQAAGVTGGASGGATAAASGEKDPLKGAPERVDFGTPAHFQLARRLAEEGRAGLLALPGTVLTLVDGRRVIVQPPTPATAPAMHAAAPAATEAAPPSAAPSGG
jgi:Ca-activated chloride channel homolog